MITFKALKQHASAKGIVITRQDGELRVAPSAVVYPDFTEKQREAIAYYTDDMADAWGTADAMARGLQA